MRIALDVSALDPSFRAHAIRGTGRYVSELYRGLTQWSEINSNSLVPLRYAETGRGSFADRMIGMFPAGRHTLRHQIVYPMILSKELTKNIDLIHFPVHADAPSWCRCPYIVTVLDLIPLIFKNLYAPTKNDLRFKFARWLELSSIKNAAGVFVISENTGRDVERLLKVPRERIIVTPLGVSQELVGMAQNAKWEGLPEILRQDRPLILYVGGIDQRKNIAFLLKSFKEVLSNSDYQDDKSPLLVMVGKIDNDLEYPKMKKIIKELGISDSVIETGYVDDRQLALLYKSATIFFYPSLYEGFGLPPLEAMSLGLPVVCSNTSSIPEVVGEAALMFDPTNINEAAQAICTLLSNPEIATELSYKGLERAKLFTWQETIRKSVSGYKQVLKII